MTHNESTFSDRRMRRLMAIAMAAVMLCTVLLVAFHHHDDDGDHDDCAICAVAHHGTADTGTAFPDFNFLPFTYLSWFNPLIPLPALTRYSQSPGNRAPPLLFALQSI